MTSPKRWPVFAIAASVTSVFFINFCDLVFRCGCRSLWAGAASHCNIHMQGMKHCPWCNHGSVAFGAIYLAVLVSQFALCSRLMHLRWFARLAVSVSVFPLIGMVAALVVGWLDNYWS